MENDTRPARVLTHQEARRFYNRIGGRQDSQGFYEDKPLRELTSRADFQNARRVAEFGCGTGRFALDLFDLLPEDALYLGLEISPVMADLARRRLKQYADRVAIVLTNGSPSLPVADGSLDRIVSNYVLDLLSTDDIRAFLKESHRALKPDGRICLTGLTWGERGIPRLVSRVWRAIHRFRPAWVGGCRPIDTAEFLHPHRWEILHCRTVVAAWIPSQTLVAQPRSADTSAPSPSEP